MSEIPKFKNRVPGKKVVLDEMDKIATNSIKRNVDAITKAKLPFSVSLDIATTKGMKNSYCGVIVSYITEELDIKSFAFDVIALKEKHTGGYLKNAVGESLSKLGLLMEDASAIVTDGASNMAKAFK